MTTHRVQIIDSHVAGEPVRLVVSGGPDLSSGPLMARQARFKTTGDHFRRALISEPRGSSLMTGAMLCAPHDPSCKIGALFFDESGHVSPPGHGVIGVIASLAHRGDLSAGLHRIDTPQGVAETTLHEDGSVTFYGEPGRRRLKDVAVEVPGLGSIVGDLAWGGAWVFLTESHPGPLTFANLETLTRDGAAIRAALVAQGVPQAEEVQICLIGPAPGVSCRSFTLRPNGAYDRSPGFACASAKIACLIEDGALAKGQSWLFQSIVGGQIEIGYVLTDGNAMPRTRALPKIYAETNVILDLNDPFCWGFPV